MNLDKYGVILNRLTHDKIEMVRNWRNDPKISQYMEFREYITPEMQEKWFKTINNDNNFFFIIEYQDKEVGLVDLKNIDYQLKTGEAGIFIYDNDYLNGIVPFCSLLCLYDFFFETLKMEKVMAHVLRDNKRAIKFNLAFGYELQPDQEQILNQLYCLERENYFEKRGFITQIL
ncbi:MAG: GNAT family N-acetyltransferase [Prevotella sp.]|jgi:RimJ/RimL family protein N-acetyltransferase|nr:GNAT family N-acetyltransferase [Prevotella sp.]